MGLLQSLLGLRRRRATRDGSVGTDVVDIRRMVIITAILLGAFARGKTAGFRNVLGCYLHSAGLTQRGNDVLAGFGLVPTYKYISLAMKKMAKRGKVSTIDLQGCVF